MCWIYTYIVKCKNYTDQSFVELIYNPCLTAESWLSYCLMATHLPSWPFCLHLTSLLMLDLFLFIWLLLLIRFCFIFNTHHLSHDTYNYLTQICTHKYIKSIHFYTIRWLTLYTKSSLVYMKYLKCCNLLFSNACIFVLHEVMQNQL